MKYLLSVVIIISTVHICFADTVAFKCRINGVITYQNKPCKKLVNLKKENEDFKTIRLDSNLNVVGRHRSAPANKPAPKYSYDTVPAGQATIENSRAPTVVGSGIENRTKKARLEREKAKERRLSQSQYHNGEDVEEKKKFQGREIKFRELQNREIKFRKRDPRELEYRELQFRDPQFKQRQSRGVKFKNRSNKSINFKNNEGRELKPILENTDN